MRTPYRSLVVAVAAVVLGLQTVAFARLNVGVRPPASLGVGTLIEAIEERDATTPDLTFVRAAANRAGRGGLLVTAPPGARAETLLSTAAKYYAFPNPVAVIGRTGYQRIATQARTRGYAYVLIRRPPSRRPWATVPGFEELATSRCCYFGRVTA